MARYPDLRYLFGGPSRSNVPISEACWLARLLKLRTERRWQYVGAAFAFRLAPLSRCESVKYDGFDMSYRNSPSTGTNTVIDLYTWTTPNGRKVSIALEEFALPYAAHAVDIGNGDQFKPDFLKISPNNRIPAIVDRDNGMSLMESGAILIYLADKTGKLLPNSGEARYRTIEWLMWQMGGPGPMFGQVHHFLKYNKGKAPYAEERYLKEARRLYGVLDRRLDDREYVADDYSIADIAIWPWVSRYEWQTIDLNQYPNVKRWYVAIAKRPATQKGYKIPKDVGEVPMPT